MRQAKRDTSWKEIETEGKWQKHDTNRFYGKKKEMITKREKQGDTQKEKETKETKKKRPNKKKLKKNEK